MMKLTALYFSIQTHNIAEWNTSQHRSFVALTLTAREVGIYTPSCLILTLVPPLLQTIMLALHGSIKVCAHATHCIKKEEFASKRMPGCNTHNLTQTVKMSDTSL
jgi:hypothetical protein